MLIPPVCFTCGKPIGHLYQKYLDRVQEISEKKEKSEQTPEDIALNELRLKRYCCRRMFLCHKDFYNEIS
jgi:DNA-directed RNA polymerase subunit N (RpoN/RPB10)